MVTWRSHLVWCHTIDHGENYIINKKKTTEKDHITIARLLHAPSLQARRRLVVPTQPWPASPLHLPPAPDARHRGSRPYQPSAHREGTLCYSSWRTPRGWFHASNAGVTSDRAWSDGCRMWTCCIVVCEGCRVNDYWFIYSLRSWFACNELKWLIRTRYIKLWQLDQTIKRYE